MKIYNVINHETGYSEMFSSLSAAKRAMKQHNALGFITWINRRTGKWEPLGEIELSGNNKTALVNNGKLTRSY